MNSLGRNFVVTLFGSSHGSCIGVTIDGVMPGIEIDLDYIQACLDRRKPGQIEFTSPRQEDDKVECLAGLNSEGLTTGYPLTFIIKNTDQRSQDYDLQKFRPNHADFTYRMKYGTNVDLAGGGQASGRMMAGIVIAGAVAKKMIHHKKYWITADAWISKIGGISTNQENTMLIENMMRQYANAGNSLGSEIHCRIVGCPIGLGEPLFDRIDAKLAHAMMSIPGTKAFQIGDGIDFANMNGYQAADEMCLDNNYSPSFKTNHNGGTLGGISNGNEILFTVTFKPTPTISKKLHTLDIDCQETEIESKGRHDVCIGLRAPIIVESMAYIVLYDLILSQSNKTIKTC